MSQPHLNCPRDDIFWNFKLYIYQIHNLSNKIYSFWKWAHEVTKELILKGFIDKVQQVSPLPSIQISVTLRIETLT